MWLLSLLLLAVTGALGLYNGVTEHLESPTALQLSVRAGVFAYGVLGWIAAWGMLRGRAWSSRAAAGWGVVITFVAATAVLAYANEEATVGGSIGAGLATAIIAAAVVWTARATVIAGTPAPR